jgi:hypothetical protein
MTTAHTKTLVRYLSLKQMRDYAAIGLNIELNGMCPEDAAEFERDLIAAGKRRNKKGRGGPRP